MFAPEIRVYILYRTIFATHLYFRWNRKAIKMKGKIVDDIVACISTLSEEDLESSEESIIEFRDSLQRSEVAKRIQNRLN